MNTKRDVPIRQRSSVWIGSFSSRIMRRMGLSSRSKVIGLLRKISSWSRKSRSSGSKNGKKLQPSCLGELANNVARDGAIMLIQTWTKENGPSQKTCSSWNSTTNLATNGSRFKSLCPAELIMTSKIGSMRAWESTRHLTNIWSKLTRRKRKPRKSTSGGSSMNSET